MRDNQSRFDLAVELKGGRAVRKPPKPNWLLLVCMAALVAAPASAEGRVTVAKGAEPYARSFTSTRPVQFPAFPKSTRSDPSIASGLEAARAAKALAAKPADAEPVLETPSRPIEGGSSAKEPRS